MGLVSLLRFSSIEKPVRFWSSERPVRFSKPDRSKLFALQNYDFKKSLLPSALTKKKQEPIGFCSKFINN